MYRPWYIAGGDALFTLILLLSVFSGFDATLTDAIFHGQTEVLVTPGLIRKEGLTLDTCASACVAEKTIKCQFFKFINNTKTCYLSETDHPNTKDVVNKLTKPGGTGSSSSKKFDGLEQSIDRLKNVQEKIENLEETNGQKASDMKALKKQSVKQVKAIVTLDGRLNSLHSQVSDIGHDLLDLEKSQRSVARSLQSVRSSTGNLGLNVKRLSHMAGELQSEVEDVRLFNSSILRQLAKVTHNTMDLDRKLNRLSTYLHDKRIFNPDEVLHTQLRISKGMSMMARSQRSFWHQLRNLEHTVDMLTSTLGRESKGTGEVHNAVLNLQTSIHNIKIAMAKLSDPMSFQNRRWQGDVDGIKHILVKLAGTNSRLDEEMRGNRREVASVIKDLTNVQMAVQSLKSNIDGVRSNNAELVESVQELLKTKSKIPSILEMTKMSTTILKSLSAIDRKERTLRSRMGQLGVSMSSLEKKMETKDTNNKLDKNALLQLSKHVKGLADDMQRINTFVMKIDKNQPSAETLKKNGAIQGKLVSAVNQLQRKVVDMDLQMKRYQNSAQRNAVKTAKTLISQSTNQWKTSLKELKSDLKELRHKGKSTERKLNRLEDTVIKIVKTGRTEPTRKCPMGTIKRGNMCIPSKGVVKENKGKKGRKEEKNPRKGKKGMKIHVKGKKGEKKHLKGKKGKKKHVKGKKGKKKHVKRKKEMKKNSKERKEKKKHVKGRKDNKKQVKGRKGKKEHAKGRKEKKKGVKERKGKKKHVKGMKKHKTHAKGKKEKKQHVRERKGKKKHAKGEKQKKQHVRERKGKKKHAKGKKQKKQHVRERKEKKKKHVKGKKVQKKPVKSRKEKMKHAKGQKENEQNERGRKEKKKQVRGRHGRKKHFRAQKYPVNSAWTKNSIGRREVRRNRRIKRETDPESKHPAALANKKETFCPPGYELVDIYCFLYLPEPQTYDMARRQCKDRKGQVSQVNSEEMQQALKLFLLVTRAEVPSVWLSAMIFNPTARKWYWEGTGDSILFENYMMDRPAGRNDEMCNQFRIEWDSHWSASPCNNDTKLPTVCYHDVDHMPPSTEKLPYGMESN